MRSSAPTTIVAGRGAVPPIPKRGRSSFEGRKGFRLETLKHSGSESEVFQQKYVGSVVVFDYG
jgi:hypothetical protein